MGEIKNYMISKAFLVSLMTYQIAAQEACTTAQFDLNCDPVQTCTVIEDTPTCAYIPCDPTDTDDIVQNCTLTVYCNPSTSLCDYCTSDTDDCEAFFSGGACNLATGVCFSNDCTDDSNICPFYETCTEQVDSSTCEDIVCTVNSECSTNYCDPTAGDQNGRCRPCKLTSDCESSQECYVETGICFLPVTCGTDNVNCQINETCSDQDSCVAPACSNWYECPNDAGCVQGVCQTCNSVIDTQQNTCGEALCAETDNISAYYVEGQCYLSCGSSYDCEEATAMTMTCSLATGLCAAADCTLDSECLSHFCGSSGICEACSEDADCPQSYQTCNEGICECSEQICAESFEMAQTCDTDNGVCIDASCQSDSQCYSYLCDDDVQICTACTVDADTGDDDCPQDYQVCSDDGRCLCSGYLCEDTSVMTTTCDATTGLCIEATCVTDSACYSGLCGSDGVCAACYTKYDCSQNYETCSQTVTGQCSNQTCTQSSECESNFCRTDSTGTSECAACWEDSTNDSTYDCANALVETEFSSSACSSEGVCTFTYDTDEGLSGGALAGIIIGAIIAVIFIALIVCYCLKGRD